MEAFTCLEHLFPGLVCPDHSCAKVHLKKPSLKHTGSNGPRHSAFEAFLLPDSGRFFSDVILQAEISGKETRIIQQSR